MTEFQRATREQARLRLALVGPEGSGKTYTALAIGQELGKTVALIDTEHGSAAKYAAGRPFDFLTAEIRGSFHPQEYIGAIRAAEGAGADVLIIDSLSHAWEGRGGVLDLKDAASVRQGENSFTAWRHATPLHNQLVEAVLASPMHVIATMRAKTEYVIEDGPGGKKKVRKVGLAPVQRQGISYEFDVVADLTVDHEMIVGKTRCPELDGQVIARPGAEVAKTLAAWLSDGAVPEYATDEQAARILELVGAYPPDEQKRFSARMVELYGTDVPARLKAADARGLIAKLEGAALAASGSGEAA